MWKNNLKVSITLQSDNPTPWRKSSQHRVRKPSGLLDPWCMLKLPFLQFHKSCIFVLYKGICLVPAMICLHCCTKYSWFQCIKSNLPLDVIMWSKVVIVIWKDDFLSRAYIDNTWSVCQTCLACFLSTCFPASDLLDSYGQPFLLTEVTLYHLHFTTYVNCSNTYFKCSYM